MAVARIIATPQALPDRRQARPRTLRRKRDLFELVTELHARHFSREFIACAVGRTPQRIGQIINLLRLEPPRFDTIAGAFTWLAAELPDLDYRCRLFRFQNESEPEHKATAAA
jgi:hypothetical protein